MADPTETAAAPDAATRPTDASAAGAGVGAPGAADSSTGPAQAPVDGGADLARRRFFREFAGEIATTAATVIGAAQALQRTSGELAGVLLDPSRLEGAAPPAAPSATTPAPADGTPVFRTAFRMEGATIRFVDQRTLPRALTEYVASSAAEVSWAIRNGTLLGGPAAGQAAAIGMALTAVRVHATKPYARRATFRGAANAMRNAAPANGSVAAAMTRVMAAYAAVGELSEDGDAIASAMQEEADRIVAEAIADHGALVEAGVTLLASLHRPADGDGAPLRVLVHGPGGTLAGGQCGTALTIAITTHQRDVPIRFVVPEGRPRFTGSRVSCWELAAAGAPHLLVADAAAPALIAAGEVDAVLVPADRVAANGDVVAAIGTYALALAAARRGVPVVACVAASAIDAASPDGGSIGIGYLDAEELDRIEKLVLAPAGTETRVPTHDVTPAELVTTWLTAGGPRNAPFPPAAPAEPASPGAPAPPVPPAEPA
jgi:methylthioribose-1-phosphate isomerase